jgi:hypothetical protein
MSLDDWKKLTDIAGLALLAFTLFLGVASWRIGNAIARRDDAAKLKLERTVLDAKDRLAAQEERTAIAERATEEIRRENIDRDVRLAVAEKDSADSKTAMAKQQERAAIAERELLELRERISPRTLDAAQFARLKLALENAEPKGPVEVGIRLGDDEAMQYKLQIVELLKAAGWPVLPGGAGVYTDNPQGVFLSVKKESDIALPQLLPLCNALKELGVPREIRLDAGVTDGGVVQVLVGAKP